MAPPAPLVALRDTVLGFGGRPLFQGLSLGLARGEHACLIGRNGVGKSTLLKVLAGEQDLDGGERFAQPGCRIGYLAQDPILEPGSSVADYVTGGLGAASEARAHRVEAALQRLGLDGETRLGTLSGGEGRRAALARALVDEPDLLLLDEPTNHLDLPTIEWLETELEQFRGALVMISHDRTFLAKASRITLWLDRGQLRRLEQGFAAFDDWAEQIRAEEERDLHRLDRRIVREERWLERGVTARRKRNQGRLARLQDLRRKRAEWLRQPGDVKLAAASAGGSGDLVIEAEALNKSFGDPRVGERVVIRNVSTRIKRGDRIGIIGPNGAGKTTLVRLLIGDLAPDSGRLRLGSNLAILYYDQRREALDPEATLWQTLAPGGGDSILVAGRQRHVVAYLRDFLFEEHQARQPVKSLSGGERNRLLLARLLARPSNLMVLDEPTNDLDMETLDLLVELLDDYAGTQLLVSHDRSFLDRLVTGILAVEGDGRVREYVGGYSDYLAQREPPQEPRPAARAKPTPAPPRKTAAKLSYKEQRELDRLPEEIARLEHRVGDLEAVLADQQLYARDPDGFAAAAARLEDARRALAGAEERWLELEERRAQLAGAP